MPFPAYSHDLNPLDYYLFWSMAPFLCLQNFINQEVGASLEEFFALKDKNWYQCGIKDLGERWLQTVQHDGLDCEC